MDHDNCIFLEKYEWLWDQFIIRLNESDLIEKLEMLYLTTKHYFTIDTVTIDTVTEYPILNGRKRVKTSEQQQSLDTLKQILTEYYSLHKDIKRNRVKILNKNKVWKE